MATINITVQSLLNAAQFDSYSVADTTTVGTFKTTIETTTGVQTDWFDLVFNEEILDTADTLAACSIVNGSQVRTHNKISRLTTLEARQAAKLELSHLERVSLGNSRPNFDILELPTHYQGNTVIDNPNPAGLLEGRPWTVGIVLDNLQLWLDAGNYESYPETGSTWVDLSPSETNGTLINSPTYSTDNLGKLTFGGTNYVDMNTSLASENFTLSVWFKCSNVTNYRMLVSKEQPSGSPWNYRMYINITNGRLIGDMVNSSAYGVTGTTNVADGNWHMGTFIRDTVTDKLYIYVDGVLQTQATDTSSGTFSQSQEVWIGRSAFTGGGANPTGSYPYVGDLAQVLIYNAALSGAEVLQNYNATKVRYV